MTSLSIDGEADSDPSPIEIRTFAGDDWPEEFLQLRRQVWERETRLLPEEGLINDNDRSGTHFLVYDKADRGRLIASTCVVEAERSDFASHTRLPANVLRDTVLSTRSTVHPDRRGQSIMPLLVYLAAREGRRRQRQWVAGYLEPDKLESVRNLTGATGLTQIPTRSVAVGDRSYEVVPTAAAVDYVASKCFRRMPEPFRRYLREHLYVDEIVAEVMSGARRFYEGAWFKAVERRSLTRWQYFKTLANMHIYVRWTTRLLGTIIGVTSDHHLRSHYLRHLQGEIDHELELESDIAHLGFDVDYVRDQMSPCEDIRTFMSLQESLCSGPRRDPRLFLAVPFAIEALTAFLTEDFLTALTENIASWGVDDPSRAMSFIDSHTRLDGGADGHWEAARSILGGQIGDERELQEFLSIARLVQESQHRAFTTYASATDIFAARPEAG